MGRIKNVKRNISYGFISKIVVLIIGFISRTIFIRVLGITYLGVDGLFTNVLGLLSLAELGVGTVMNYSLYKPVAEDNIEKIKSIMHLYKRAYIFVAIIIAALGLVLVPFLKFFVKNPGDISVNQLTVFYLIFLFNTVSSYFISYKYSVVNAEQKNYIQVNIDLITRLLGTVAQLIILLIFKSFLFYLLTQAIVYLVQKIVANMYLNKRYPYLLEKNIEPLSNEEKAPIIKNCKALFLHKLAGVTIGQTDNIIMSAFIGVSVVGLVSNYTLLIRSISGVIAIIFTYSLSSLGNLVATEPRKKQVEVFDTYFFVNFWLYGFTGIAFTSLLQPFITLWIGTDKLIGIIPVSLICLNYYFIGQRSAFLNFKTAFGVFYDDKYVVLISAVINLVLSIALVKIIGLTGIYIGTIAANLYQSIRRPIIAYERITGRKAKYYFKVLIKYFLTVLGIGIPLTILINIYLKDITLAKFIISVLIVGVIPNLYFYVLYKETVEFNRIKSIILAQFRRSK